MRAWLAALLLVPGPSAGQTLDASGKLPLTAVWSESFEGRLTDWTFYDGEGAPMELAAEAQVGAGPRALAGERVLRLGGQVGAASLPLAALSETYRGRRVELTLWQRAGSSLHAWLVWTDMAALPLVPTARATSDGWREWSTGPVDFALGGLVDPGELLLLPYDLDPAGLFDAETAPWLDALQLHDLGPAEVPAAECRAGDASQRCGPHGTCLFGQCVDGAAVLGPALRPRVRADYLARQRFYFQEVEGSRAARRRGAAFAGEVARLAQQDTAVAFWPGLFRAVAALGDGHAQPARPALVYPYGSGVCASLGEADLIPGSGVLPMVFRPGTGLGHALLPGDVVVRADGQPIWEWVDAQLDPWVPGGDPGARRLEAAGLVFDHAARSGSELELLRCPDLACAAPERVLLDLRRALSGLWRGEPPADPPQPVGCDHRFRPAVEGPAELDPLWASASEADGVRTLIINGVLGATPEWFAAVDQALAPGVERLILDQRTGLGGTFPGLNWVLAPLVPDQQEAWAELFAGLVPELSAMELRNLRLCAELDPPGCPSFFSYRPEGQVRRGRAAGARVAVLLGLDASGNDYLSWWMAERPGATRLFGPAPTVGAFGAVTWLPPLFAGDLPFVQWSDTLFFTPEEEFHTRFATGAGVAPDVVLAQKQSDALRGVDTLMEAARAWLAEGP